MLRRDQEVVLQMLQVVDALLLCFALFVAHSIRYNFFPLLPNLDINPIVPFTNYIWAVVLLLPLGPLVLERQDLYRLTTERTPGESLWRIGKAVLILLVLLFIFTVALRIPQETISRMAFLLFVPTSVLFIGARDAVTQAWLRGRGRRLITRQHVLLCGTDTSRQKWKDEIAALPGERYTVVEELDLRDVSSDDFVEKLHVHAIDIVVFLVDHTNMPEIRDSLIACESEGIEAWVSADFFGTTVARPTFDQLAHRPLLVYRSTPDASFELIAKRGIDILGSAFLLAILSPFLLGIALIIRFTSGSPVIFSQKRSGLYGRPFTMYKFRTMVANAAEVQKELEEKNKMSGPVFKVEDDPRVTPFGRWLRRTSFDELPQLYNVWRGEMSLVGPRPLPLYETEKFDHFSHRRRMSVKPGLTCLWQIRGRNEITSFDDWVRLDLEYIDNWSIWLDIKILVMTIPVVLFGRGAE